MPTMIKDLVKNNDLLQAIYGKNDKVILVRESNNEKKVKAKWQN